MSVEVTFEEDGGNGLVAAGASLWEAGKRLGIGLRADCKGLGECDGCAVRIIQGGDLLSPATAAELKVLGAERLLAGERLACQTILVKTGEIMVRIVPRPEGDKQKQKQRAGKTLSFKQQLGVLIETEAKAISEAVNMIRGKSNALVEKFLNLNQEKPGAGSKKDNK